MVLQVLNQATVLQHEYFPVLYTLNAYSHCILGHSNLERNKPHCGSAKWSTKWSTKGYNHLRRSIRFGRECCSNNITKYQTTGYVAKYWPLLTILWHEPPFIQIKKRVFVRKNSQILATDPVFKTETNVVIKKKNGFKTKLNSFSPMEPIEECSMEMSSEKKDEADSR